MTTMIPGAGVTIVTHRHIDTCTSHELQLKWGVAQSEWSATNSLPNSLLLLHIKHLSKKLTVDVGSWGVSMFGCSTRGVFMTQSFTLLKGCVLYDI